MSEGSEVSSVVGAEVGSLVDSSVDFSVGSSEGSSLGAEVGSSVGAEVGVEVGGEVGSSVGDEVGVRVGVMVGVTVGAVVGAALGSEYGSGVGGMVQKKPPCLGNCVGISEGSAVRLLLRGSWVLTKLGDDDAVFGSVGADGFLVGFGWVGRFDGLDEGLSVEGRGVVGRLVGFEAMISAPLNDRKMSTFVSAGNSKE